MFRKNIERLLILLLIFTISAAPFKAAAADRTLSFPAQYLEVTFPDNISTFDKDTGANDPIWLKAGVINVKDRKEEFESMGVLTAFFDEETETLITLNSKSNSATAEKFSFAAMTEAEILDYMQSQLATEDKDIETSVEMSGIGEVPFFRAQILVTTPGSEAIEVLYGTLINGSMLTFDIFEEGVTEVNEALVQQLVSGTHFTKVLTYAEYEELIKKSYRRFVGIMLGIVAFFIAIIVVARLASKSKKNQAVRLSERMAEFRRRKTEGKVDLTSEPRFINDTVYDEQLVSVYTLYNTWLKSIFTQGVVGICFLVVVLYLFKCGGSSTIYAIFTAAIGVSLLFMRNSFRERTKSQMNKQYDTHSKKKATVRFFEEYFTVSGLSSVTEFIYAQVRSVKVYNGYIYLYVSDNQAVILDGEGFSKGEPEELVDFVNTARKQQK